MKIIGPLLSAIAALLLCTTEPTEANPAPPAAGQAVITITFDDSYKSQFANAFPILKQYGLTATAYVITRDIGDAADDPIWTPMSWNDIRALRDAGWEIGSHTLTHPHLPKLNDRQLQDELLYSAKHIAKELGQMPAAFAAPYGEVDARVNAAIAKIYQNAAITGDVQGEANGVNRPGRIDRYNIARLVVLRDTLPEEVCDAVDNAVDQHVWLVLTFHQVMENPPTTSQGDYMTSKADFEQIAKCISDRVKAGSLKAMNMTEAVAALQPGATASKLDAPTSAKSN